MKSGLTGMEWVRQMKESIHLELHQLPASIFRVAEPVKKSNPESYTPQLVGLGPFHHFQPQLQEMKAVKRRFTQQALRRLNFPAAGDHHRVFADKVVAPLLPIIRANYDSLVHTCLDDATLASVLAIDWLFSVELLIGHGTDDNDDDYSVPGKMKKKLTLHSVLMNDVVMLENQIPLFLLLDHTPTTEPSFQKMLCHQLDRVCEQISPLKLQPEQQQVSKPRHFLEYLYFQIVAGMAEINVDSDSSLTDHSPSSPSPLLHILGMAPPGFLSPPGKDRRSNVGVIDVLKETTQVLVPNVMGNWLDQGFSWCQKLGIMNGVLIESDKPLIPTASQLTRLAGVKIVPSHESSTIRFDEQGRTLCLPAFTWKPGCEVVMRNLLAYESMAIGDYARVLTAYWEVMGWLVRGAKDVELLREAGVIGGDFAGGGSKSAVVSLFGGGGSKRRRKTTRVATVESQIQAVNSWYYDNRRKAGIFGARRRKQPCMKLGFQICVLLVAGLVPMFFVFLPLFGTSFGDCYCLTYCTWWPW